MRAFGVVPDSCETRLVVPQAPLDPAAMAATIQDLEVVNLVRTPLGASLEAVAADLGTAPGPKIVVFVTDGEETCGGDSAAAIQALVDSGIDVRVNIVGFALDDEALKAQFEEWARIGNGRYIDAGNAAELTAAVAEAVLPVYTDPRRGRRGRSPPARSAARPSPCRPAPTRSRSAGRRGSGSGMWW